MDTTTITPTVTVHIQLSGLAAQEVLKSLAGTPVSMPTAIPVVTKTTTATTKKKAAPVQTEMDLDETNGTDEISEPDSDSAETVYADDDDDTAALDEATATTLSDVKKAVISYAKKHSPEKARAILKKFKAKNASEVKEADYDKVIGAMSK